MPSPHGKSHRPRPSSKTRFWYIGKRNKNTELLGLIFAVALIGGGAWASLSAQSRELLLILASALVGILFIGVAGFASYKAYRHSSAMRALSIAQVDAMSGRQFEWYVAALLKHQGYHAVVTKASGDYGADIIATKGHEKWAVQTKCYANPVGNSVVGEVVAGKGYYRCDRAMAVTNSTFTPNARVAARANHTTLIARDQLAEWVLAFRETK